MDIKRAGHASLAALVITLVLVGAIVLGAVFDSGEDADLSYRSLDYEATALPSGDLRVTQHIDMKLRERSTDDDDGYRPWKQLYQQYTLKATNLTDISGISVTNVTEGRTYTQIDPKLPSDVDDAQWDSEYAGHWYIADVTENPDDPQPYRSETDALISLGGEHDAATGAAGVADKTVEIGWNIPATKEADSLRFDVTFTMKGVATLYNDVAQFQWEPFGARNQVPIGTLTGTVRFPEGITASNSWAWLHYEGNAETSRGPDGELRFTAYDVRSNSPLDVVAAFDSSAAQNVRRVWYRDGLPALKLSEAQQEQAWRDKQRAAARVRLILWIVFAVAGIAVAVFAVLAARRSVKAARYQGDIEYWRDPPALSPASAAKLMQVVDGVGASETEGRAMSATMLSLASKRAIAIYPGSVDRYRGVDLTQASPKDLVALTERRPESANQAEDTCTIVVQPVAQSNPQLLNLSESERALLNLLKEMGDRFDLKQMRNHCKGWKRGYELQQVYATSVNNEFALLGAVNTSGGVAGLLLGIVEAIIGFAAILTIGIMGNIPMGTIVGVPAFFVGIWVSFYTKLSTLTVPRGQTLAGQCEGLKRYMCDFSDFSDRGVPDLALWDRYLVYATAFGIADRACRELAKASPELVDPTWLDDHASDFMFYWYVRPYCGYPYHHDQSSSDGALASGAGSMPTSFNDLGVQLNAGLAEIRTTIQAAAPDSAGSSGGSGGSFSGGSFGGSFGGSGGGSFGGR